MNDTNNNARTLMLQDARKVRFLRTYSKCGVIGPACKTASISRTTYLRWRKVDDEFDEACDDAFDEAVDEAEYELRERGINGTEEPVLYKGTPVWKRDPGTGAVLLDDDFNPIPFTIHRKSDRLLEVYTRTHRPQYREKSEVSLTGRNGGPLEVVTVQYILPEGKTQADYVEDYRDEQKTIDITPEKKEKEFDPLED